MRNRLILTIACLWLGSSAWGQTTTITGTIKDLTNTVVSSGKVVFTLKPSVDTTISGNARFTPGAPITCYIQSNGTLLNAAQSAACIVTTNTSLTPAGTSYRVDICPYMACASSFNFYAINGSYDISTIVPTPTTGPAQNFADVFSNQNIAGNKTFTGTTQLNGQTSLFGLSTTCGLNGHAILNPGCYSGSDIGAQVNSAYAACPSSGCPVDIPPGTYSFSTPIIGAASNKALVLLCPGYGANSFGPTILNYTPSTGTAVTLASGLGSSMKGCTLNGSGSGNSSVGISISNSSGGTQTQGVLEDNSVSLFGTCLLFGNNSYLMSFRSNAIFNCTKALFYPNTVSGSGENLVFYGGFFTCIPGSYSASCVDVEANAETLSFSGVSFDTAGITLNATGINFLMAGGNLENLGSVTTLDFLTIGSGCTQCSVTLDGVNAQEDGNGAGRTHLITNGANGSKLVISGGKYATGSEGAIAGLVNAASGSATILIAPQTPTTPTALVTGSGAYTTIDKNAGVNTTAYFTLNGTSWTAGAGAPAGNCLGSAGIYTNSSAASASTVLYVCQANTWTAVTVP